MDRDDPQLMGESGPEKRMNPGSDRRRRVHGKDRSRSGDDGGRCRKGRHVGGVAGWGRGADMMGDEDLV